MRKFFNIKTQGLAWLILISDVAGAQHDGLNKQLEPEKNKLESLSGIEKFNQLICITKAYLSTSILYTDSSMHYAGLAFQEAEALDYRLGLYQSTSLLARISLELSEVNEGLKYYRLAREYARLMNKEDLVIAATRGIGQALWYQGKFSLAIDSISRCVDYYKAKRTIPPLSDATMVLSSIAGDMGQYDKAFDWAEQALRYSQQVNDQPNIILALVQIGYLYRNIGDLSTAMQFYYKAASYRPPHGEWCFRLLSNRMGEVFLEKKQFDSALYCFNQSRISHPSGKTTLLRMGDYFLSVKEYDSSLLYYDRVHASLKEGGEGNLLIFSLLGKSRSWLGKDHPQIALLYGEKALELAAQRDTRLTLRDAYQLLAAIHDTLKNGNMAYQFYRKYVSLKDTVLNDQLRGRLYAFSQQLDNEQEETRIRWLNRLLTGGLLFILVLGLIIFRNISLKRKNEQLRHGQEQTELKQRAAELEMQALRAQMNPHFIFNALSSVNRYILKNDADKASDYLTRFSRLIRLVLINSKKEVVLLEEEIEMLKLYLQIEQLRFTRAFEYHIHIGPGVDTDGLRVPPLILQPFCENAIWHGLMHQDQPGRLDIEFNMDQDVLHCTITDNGVGRSRAAQLEPGNPDKIQSIGLQLTRERLTLFNEDPAVHTSFEIMDLTDRHEKVCGTRVELRFRQHYSPNKKNQLIHDQRPAH